MADIASTALIIELEDAVKGGSSERRVQMLRQVTDLFLSGGDRLNQQQIDVFDDVLVRLIERIEAKALARLSTTLAEVSAAPPEAVRRLAYHEQAEVAVPVLLKSDCLSEGDLIEIASQRGEAHLVAISGRKALNEALTDVLLKRGGTDVHRVLAKNSGAHFSETGYSTLVATAEGDEDITESLGLRADIPLRFLRDLLSRATEAVRSRLLSLASPEMRQKIAAVIESVTAKMSAVVLQPIDCTEAQSAVKALNQAGKLNDSSVNRFAMRHEHANIIASLSLLSAVSIEAIKPLMDEPGCNGLVVACRASQLSWFTTLAIINARRGIQPVAAKDAEPYKEAFETLSLASAQRTMRFWSARSSAAKSA